MTAAAAFCTAEGRWIITSNVDSQRLFDEELDGLGFQLKEWPWHWGRGQLIADLCQGRNVACDQPQDGCVTARGLWAVGSFVRGIVVSPDGRNVYVASEDVYLGAVAIFRRLGG